MKTPLRNLERHSDEWQARVEAAAQDVYSLLAQEGVSVRDMQDIYMTVLKTANTQPHIRTMLENYNSMPIALSHEEARQARIHAMVLELKDQLARTHRG